MLKLLLRQIKINLYSYFKIWKSLIQSSKPRNIQSYIWPAIKKGLDIITIGTAKSGKTTGYVFAICGLLATNANVKYYLK